MRLHYIQHADFEGLGIIAQWAQQHQHSVSCTKIFAGEILPSVKDFDVLICMRGPQSPFAYTEYPYLTDERDFIAAAIAADKYVVGFCLGAQLIGEALGAKTEKSPHKEVGMFPIELTAAGRAASVFKNFPTMFKVLHWHNDMPGIPVGAEVLAHSVGCPRQIFRVSDKVYGFQCHFEPMRDNVATMAKCDADMLTASQYTQTLEQLLAEDYTAMNELACQFLDAWLNTKGNKND